jgi:hypothetical protein
VVAVVAMATECATPHACSAPVTSYLAGSRSPAWTSTVALRRHAAEQPAAAQPPASP